MKTNRSTLLAAVALSLAAFSTAGCAEKEQAAAAPLPPAKESPVAVAPVVAAPDVTMAHWSDIKDFSFDQRAQFFTGYSRLEAQVDAQIAELTARRAAMPAAKDTKDWDFAMKEMADSRVYLHGSGESLGKATPDTWSQLKDTAGVAWVRTQDAYAKVKASTTN